MEQWKQITSDVSILNSVRGARIEFHDDSFDCSSLCCRKNHNLGKQEVLAVDEEIQKLLACGVISPCSHVEGEVISPIFTRDKKDGTKRMILNLSKLNDEVTYHHFKMDTLASALTLITPNCYMASLDLKQAYYSVPICRKHRKLLRFQWRGQLFEYNALPNGLSSAPRLFTKIMKPVFATLRAKGHVSAAFLDDSLLMAESYEQCTKNVADSLALLRKLGFIIHPTKSELEPTRRIQYLGVIIDSESMKVKLTPERIDKILKGCVHLLSAVRPSIRDLARVIGMIVASFPAVKFGPLHYRQLEKDKTAALKISKGDFDQGASLSLGAKAELRWWIDNVSTADNDVYVSEPDIVLASDASSTEGWGFECQGVSAGGHWLPHERLFHINYLEMKAAFFALQAFRRELRGKHVRLMLDNTTAVACVNHMGTSHSDGCNEMGLCMWSWCIDNKIYISAAHIPGKENVVADRESRDINMDAEWQLNRNLLFQALYELGVQPEIDLFASRVNHQFDRFMSYRPDPQAEVIDAFSVSWKNLSFYAFPPFSIIGRVLQKIQRERASGVLVVPDWPTQYWYPVVRRLAQQTIRLTNRRQLLRFPPRPEEVHPLIQQRRLNLLVCRI